MSSLLHLLLRVFQHHLLSEQRQPVVQHHSLDLPHPYSPLLHLQPARVLLSSLHPHLLLQQTSLVVASTTGVQMCIFGVLNIIKEWNTELEERTGSFRKQANAIAEWDKRILHNSDVLLRLEVKSLRLVKDVVLSLHLIMYAKLYVVTALSTNLYMHITMMHIS
ncbi:BnaC09g47500D [Brassica napus]|uniref:BnaC09g47500D protein n=1 Tax=Brassica napus TaxID=3708 RepID=A0A078G977_BRANA|nr:BnaC09g47500D [Brassica napus]